MSISKNELEVLTNILKNYDIELLLKLKSLSIINNINKELSPRTKTTLHDICDDVTPQPWWWHELSDKEKKSILDFELELYMKKN